MKITRFISMIALGATALAFTACEHSATIETIVSSDGSIRRNIVLKDADSASAHMNVFGISEDKGWTVAFNKSAEKSNKAEITFSKSFHSIDDANAEMNTADEATFHIRSDMEKRFRWFYTYYRYSDTYASLNRIRYVRQEDYFTPEDYAFIKRLPAEGKPMSKADSFFLEKLGDRIYDDFAARGFYEESFETMMKALEATNVAQAWRDSVMLRKESYFKELLAAERDNFDDYSPLFSKIKGFPGDNAEIQEAYQKLIKDFERRSNFMTTAVNMKLVHMIELPGAILETNADSVHNNRAFWAPPPLRYMLGDYTMYAESRSLNIWAVVLSAIVVIATIALYIVRHKSLSTHI